MKAGSCDFCSKDLRRKPFVDGATVAGVWACLCLTCHEEFGVGLGPGKGQQYDERGNLVAGGSPVTARFGSLPGREDEAGPAEEPVILVFTGTRKGMTPEQAGRIRAWLIGHPEITALRHGCAAGADAEMHAIVREHRADIGIIGHPAQPGETVTQECDILLPPDAPLARNREMVLMGDLLLACPGGPEILRSGTWATVRYARQRKLPITLIYPDGTLEAEEP